MTARKTDKKLLAWCSAVFFASCSLSAYADDTTDVRLRSLADGSGITPTTSTPVENNAPAAATSNKPSATPGEHHGQALEKAACFTAGVVVKTPKAIVRNAKTETIGDTKELIGDSKNPILVGAASALSLPFGVTSGLCEGICSGIVHSWKHCFFNEKNQSQPAP
jgi:hypothetical protein